MASPNSASFRKEADDVFGRIASRYDFLCDLFSLGIHRIWKARVADRIASRPWETLLDAGTGTGDIVRQVVLRSAGMANRRVLATDNSAPMLAIARERISHLHKDIEFGVMDIQSLVDVSDESVDTFSTSLVLKICDRTKALNEAFRVLRPGGQLVILEASRIRWQFMHRLYLFYMSMCMPALGYLATGGDAAAYRYLLEGVRNFPGAEELSKEIALAGFSEVTFERMSLGIVAIHTAVKPL